MAQVGEVFVSLATQVNEKELLKTERRLNNFSKKVKKLVNPIAIASALAGASLAGLAKKAINDFEKGSDSLDSYLSKLDAIATLSSNIGATDEGTRALQEALAIRGVQDPEEFIRSFQDKVSNSPNLQEQFRREGIDDTANQLLAVLGGLSKTEDPQVRNRQLELLGISRKQAGELTSGDFSGLVRDRLESLQSSNFGEVVQKGGALQEQQAIRNVDRERESLLSVSGVTPEAIRKQAEILDERQRRNDENVRNLESVAENVRKFEAVTTELDVQTKRFVAGISSFIDSLGQFQEAFNGFIAKLKSFGGIGSIFKR